MYTRKKIKRITQITNEKEEENAVTLILDKDLSHRMIMHPVGDHIKRNVEKIQIKNSRNLAQKGPFHVKSKSTWEIWFQF